MKMLVLFFAFTISLQTFAAENTSVCAPEVERYVKALLKLEGVDHAEYCNPSLHDCISTLRIENQSVSTKTYFVVYETNRFGYGNLTNYLFTDDNSCLLKSISIDRN
jgi:hypothetical protein